MKKVLLLTALVSIGVVSPVLGDPAMIKLRNMAKGCPVAMTYIKQAGGLRVRQGIYYGDWKWLTEPGLEDLFGINCQDGGSIKSVLFRKTMEGSESSEAITEITIE